MHKYIFSKKKSKRGKKEYNIFHSNKCSIPWRRAENTRKHAFAENVHIHRNCPCVVDTHWRYIGTVYTCVSVWLVRMCIQRMLPLGNVSLRKLFIGKPEHGSPEHESLKIHEIPFLKLSPILILLYKFYSLPNSWQKNFQNNLKFVTISKVYRWFIFKLQLIRR